MIPKFLSALKFPIKMILDDLDKRILNQIQIDSGITNYELSNRVHASPPTCLRRVKRLIEGGVIAKQVALLALEKLSPRLTAIVEITLDVQTSECMLEFESTVTNESAVQQCYRVSPGPDFVLIVQVEDMQAYHALAHRMFATQRNIRNVRSYFSINRSKFETKINI